MYVGTSSYGVLIDAGNSCKQLKLALKNADIDPSSVKAIFVTHEHSDHVKGLRVLASSLKVPVYATGGTLSGLNGLGILDGSFSYQKLLPGGVDVGDIHISGFRTSHDAKESCGYRIDLPGASVGIATDTGKITDEIINALSGCGLVLLESNYDYDMLMTGIYPPQLKARIRSDIGHLSNDDCAETVCSLLDLNVRRFVLGHLSRENNRPEIAFSSANGALRRMGARQDRDYSLSVAPVGPMDGYMVF
ncbi:MAG: MBL fold metallo-hydrolase [Clostridia bacterium]|nr:MBL fold metallo-hydrolase [Clostridia bacterium]